MQKSERRIFQMQIRKTDFQMQIKDGRYEKTDFPGCKSERRIFQMQKNPKDGFSDANPERRIFQMQLKDGLSRCKLKDGLSRCKSERRTFQMQIRKTDFPDANPDGKRTFQFGDVKKPLLPQYKSHITSLGLDYVDRELLFCNSYAPPQRVVFHLCQCSSVVFSLLAPFHLPHPGIVMPPRGTKTPIRYRGMVDGIAMLPMVNCSNKI
ncbi:hypothetical protein CEXT_463671 [Caerostris extrusa]|uniref:Uncharacterized protein n=1 Tax=Caerostris extrusa TaxID=172846 RepID=A0AAV4P4G7_CAEEX|nr:hypothetical protein CEXT_463671 [Caerostris extrusa]